MWEVSVFYNKLVFFFNKKHFLKTLKHTQADNESFKEFPIFSLLKVFPYNTLKYGRSLLTYPVLYPSWVVLSQTISVCYRRCSKLRDWFPTGRAFRVVISRAANPRAAEQNTTSSRQLIISWSKLACVCAGVRRTNPQTLITQFINVLDMYESVYLI